MLISAVPLTAPKPFTVGQGLASLIEPTQTPSTAVQYCGTVAIVGRPNVGKSTLLNALVGQKVSITSRRPQTTRHRIVGVCTRGEQQFVFVDTPGFQTQHTGSFNRMLNKTVQTALEAVDLVLFVVQAGVFNEADAKVLKVLREFLPEACPLILVANKRDLLQSPADLATWLTSMMQPHLFEQWVPLSARSPKDIERLLSLCGKYLPQQAWWYEEDAVSDRSEGFLIGELVREKLFRQMGDELPYTSTVVVDKFEAIGALKRITATIVVKQASHKGMVIGYKGERLKKIGSQARQDLEKLLGGRVFLQLWVKVCATWADDAVQLRAYGYG